MRHFIIGTVVTAIAFAVVAYVLPEIKLGGEISQLLITAVIFGVVNAVIKPIVKILSFPINLATLGLFSFVVNAALLLLVAWVSTEVFKSPFTIGGFPTHGLSLNAIVWAVVGSIGISIVSSVIGIVVPD